MRVKTGWLFAGGVYFAALSLMWRFSPDVAPEASLILRNVESSLASLCFVLAIAFRDDD